MIITITGSLGNISKPLAETLIKNGHEVTVIRSMGIMGNNYGAHTQLAMADPGDIAAAAAAAQTFESHFEGKSHQYMVSEKCELADIVKVLGLSIDKPDLQWVQFSDDQTFAGMTAAGMSKAIASVYVEMGNAINSGILFEDYNQKSQIVTGTKLTDFASKFAAVYKSQQQA